MCSGTIYAARDIFTLINDICAQFMGGEKTPLKGICESSI